MVSSGQRAVVNAGPLIALAVAGELELLGRLFARPQGPLAVFREVTEAGNGRPGAAEIRSAAFLDVVTLNPRPDSLLELELGAGEAEVIALARQTSADLVILDERRARRIAEQVYHLRVKGTAGILVSAKRQGFLSHVRPALDRMRANGYFIAENVVARACLEAGE